MLFTATDHKRIVAGEFSVTYRLWKRPHAKAGNTYPTGFGGSYAVDDVTMVRARDITDKDAWAAGSANRAALLQLVGAHTKTKVTPSMQLTRVAFTYRAEEKERPAPLDVDDVIARLVKLGAWTRTCLQLVDRHPRVVARALAAEAGFDKVDFKWNMRKLRKLGLVELRPRGYDMTELGQRALDELRTTKMSPTPLPRASAAERARTTRAPPQRKRKRQPTSK